MSLKELTWLLVGDVAQEEEDEAERAHLASCR